MKATGSGVLEDLTFKISEGSDQNWSCLPCWLSQLNWDSQQGRLRTTSKLVRAFWNFKLSLHNTLIPWSLKNPKSPNVLTLQKEPKIFWPFWIWKMVANKFQISPQRMSSFWWISSFWQSNLYLFLRHYYLELRILNIRFTHGDYWVFEASCFFLDYCTENDLFV